jgi:hypothetical protein
MKTIKFLFLSIAVFSLMILINVKVHAQVTNPRRVLVTDLFKLCSENRDCIVVGTRCDGCCEVAAVNLKSKISFEALFTKTCGREKAPPCACGGGASAKARCNRGKCTVLPEDVN